MICKGLFNKLNCLNQFPDFDTFIDHVLFTLINYNLKIHGHSFGCPRVKLTHFAVARSQQLIASSQSLNFESQITFNHEKH